MSRTLTIEDMIKQGASWVDIKTKVEELQKEEAERKAAEERAKAKAQAEATRAKRSAAALDRMIVGFSDWCIAEGLLPEKEKGDFIVAARAGFDEIASEVRQMIAIGKFLRR